MKSAAEKSQLLASIFAHQFELGEANWDLISEKVDYLTCKRGACIRAAEKLESNLYFLLEGATGTVMYKQDKLVCIDICFESEFFGDYQALLTQQKSALEVRALINCTYLVIPFEQLLKVYAELSEIDVERVARKSAEQLFFLKYQEVIELKTLNAQERYARLLERHRDVALKIPVKYLASYLGITPESLSRIRKLMVKTDFLP